MSKTLLLVGTAKGLFRLYSEDRTRWELQGPDFPQTPCYTAVVDPRDGTIYAGVNSEFYGPSISRSRDFGETWDSGGEGLTFASDDPEKVTCVWSITPGGPGEPGLVYAGVEASGLFVSNDGGDHWAEVATLRRHPTHDLWMPGNGGKCLHTVALGHGHAGQIYVACSAGGLYRSDDAGGTWSPANAGIEARFLPEDRRYPVAGQCVHKFSLTGSPSRIWLQNHGGVYRSDDGGERWLDVSNGLPGDFGFPILAHPTDPDTAYVIPLQADMRRWAREAALGVWATQDAGLSWQRLGEGLPVRSYAGVLRDAFHHDSMDPLGLYFGTTSGSLFASDDGGAHWRELAAHLPRVLSVRAARIPG